MWGKAEIRGTASRLGVSIGDACLLWMRLWEWADAETVDGHVAEVDAGDIDAIVGHDGFAAAAVAVKWLILQPDRTGYLPHFERHNGSSAKARARKAAWARAQKDKK